MLIVYDGKKNWGNCSKVGLALPTPVPTLKTLANSLPLSLSLLLVAREINKAKDQTLSLQELT
jgi:hypothetical protein